MPEYPIQIRWPYMPPIYRGGMKTVHYLQFMAYLILYNGTSADYIRTAFAYKKFLYAK